MPTTRMVSDAPPRSRAQYSAVRTVSLHRRVRKAMAGTPMGNSAGQERPRRPEVGALTPPSGTTTYTYNGQGLRMSETPAYGAALTFTWETVGSDPLVLDDGVDAYIYGPTLFGGAAPIEQINLTSKAPSYLSATPSGVQTVFNESGSLSELAEYSPYGVQTIQSGAMTTPFGFQGSYQDASGLDYMVNRYYDSTSGEFLSVDPDVSETGQPYSAFNSDPMNVTDPLGLEGWYCISGQTHYYKGNLYGDSGNGKCNGENSQSGAVLEFLAMCAGHPKYCQALAADQSIGVGNSIASMAAGTAGASATSASEYYEDTAGGAAHATSESLTVSELEATGLEIWR